MKYTEILEAYWSTQNPETHAKLFAAIAVHRAWKVIRLFEDRRGFEHWWDEIDEEIQDEIFDDLVKILRK